MSDNNNLTIQNVTPDPLVQYIAVRSDLKWPKGALIAQACHASIAAVHLNYSDKETRDYLENLDSMHKVVVGVPSETDLIQLSKELNDNDIKFKLWTEQPENLPTSLALKPYTKSLVEKFFRAFKLLR
jgi:peptidyl-tRNA hydrolase